MKIKMKSVVSIAMALCLAMVVLLGSTMEVQAAAYKKIITKTVTIKRGKQAVFMMDFKDDDDSIKVKVNVVGKAKGLNLQAVIPEVSASGNITGKKKKVSFSADTTLEKGIHSVYVSNYGAGGKVKVKITVTSSKANLKLKSCKLQSAEG